jgi:HEAT repeat protein
MPLLAQLKDKDPELRKLVIEILLKIGKPAVEAMAAGLADPNPDTRRMTADSLGKIGDPKALPILGEALQDPYGIVREAAARAMELLGWQPEGDAEMAIRAVALRDWNQAASLGAAAVPSLVAALKDPDPRLAEAATDTLTKVGPAAAPALLEILKDENPIRRSQAARALGEMRITEAAPDLIEALHDPDGTVRENVVLALWRMGGPDAVAGLIQALEDSDGLIRSRAARALGEINAEQAVEPLFQLAAKDPYARSAAALAVWKLAPVKAVKPLALWAADDATADEAIVALTQLLEQSASSLAVEDLHALVQLLKGHVADKQSGRGGLVKRADPSTVCSLAEKELARRAT